MSGYTKLVTWYRPHGGIRYITTEPIKWDVGFKGSGFTFSVPVGTVFDVSIPEVFRWCFDPHDKRFHKAACLHDTMLIGGWPRSTAGAEFNEALRADGVGKWSRFAMFCAVVFWRWR